jgi:hypothetical protein
MTPPIPPSACTEDPAKKTDFDRDLFLSWSVGWGVRSCTVISRRYPIVKQKGNCAVWATLGRSFVSLQGPRSFGTGMTPHPGPRMYRGPCKKNKLRPRFFSQLVGRGVRSCTVISRRHPIVKQKGNCAVWPTLGRSFISLQGPRSFGTGMTPPIPTSTCTEDPAKKTNFDRDFFLSWSVGGAVVDGNLTQAPPCKTKMQFCGLAHSR